MDFVWSDGGRAASGFIGLTGDCVTRSVAIATGTAYRDVYSALGAQCEKSPRSGVPVTIAATYLAEKGWKQTDCVEQPFECTALPLGVVIVYIAGERERSSHFCTVIDHVVHDTWNPADDDFYRVISYWTNSISSNESKHRRDQEYSSTHDQDLTQEAFDKILRRLRALDNTANNNGSTEAEKHNALRMMQSLMLRNNLTREDIVDEGDIDRVQFTRMACPVNGRRACHWERELALYVTEHILPTTQRYTSCQSNRTFFWFYGPTADVRNAVALYRELLLTIATSAQLQFGGHSRGSGASYAEGYVQGLPRSFNPSETVSNVASTVRERALIHHRTLIVHESATRWLEMECNIRLTTLSRMGRSQHDEAAASRGKEHGSQHEITVPNAPMRIGKK